MYDTANKYLVSMRGDDIYISKPPKSMTRAEALNLASWLVAMADPLEVAFPTMLAKVQNS